MKSSFEMSMPTPWHEQYLPKKLGELNGKKRDVICGRIGASEELYDQLIDSLNAEMAFLLDTMEQQAREQSGE